MDFETHKANWDTLAQRDAMWAVLTWDGKQDRNWNADEFFATGRAECALMMDVLRRRSGEPRFSRALDFGCGVGRMTQALASVAQHVTGVDLSAGMIEQARRWNPLGERLRFVHNPRPDLAQFAAGEFDLVHSLYVLQHMHPRFALDYLAEFLRVLRPGGVLIFQMASDYLGSGAGAARTAAAGRLHRTAMRAELTGDFPLLAAWRPAEAQIRVTNRSTHAWPALPAADGRFQVKLGARWRNARGRVVHEDQRTLLHEDVPPGATVTVPLRLCAPGEPGAYTLDVDLLQEDVGWFARFGASGLQRKLEVVPAPAGDAPPEVQMYCLPRARVLEHLLEHGAASAHTEANQGAGPAFTSHTWWVVRGEPPPPPRFAALRRWFARR